MTVLLFIIAAIGAWEWLIAQKITQQRIEFIQKNFNKKLKPPSLGQRFAKRLTDIIISVTVCLTLLPLLYLVLGSLIKLTSKGPIIFKQKRTGLFGKEFVCYKFRSMYENDVKMFAFEGDSRITPIGRFIRKTHLDEFPQFFNVLLGNMSIVGARPSSGMMKDTLKDYPDYPYRLLLRPGITGLSQINSERFLHPRQMIRLDTYYFFHCLWWFDIKIIWRTVKFKDKTV